MRQPQGFAFVQKQYGSPLWHISPLEYKEGSIFLVLCGLTFEPVAFSMFKGYVATTRVSLCIRCISEYNLALDTVERMLMEQKKTITLTKDEFRWLN
jgi:hypothetical protein